MDLALEQDLGWNTVFSVSYMGSLGRELAAAVDQSVAPANPTATFEVLDNPTPTGGYITYPHGGKPLPLLPNSLHTYKKYTASTAVFSPATTMCWTSRAKSIPAITRWWCS